MTLKELPIGETATILSVGGKGALRQHLLDMGLIQGAEVTVVKYAPMGDPIELKIHGYELTIRLDDAAKIEISSIPGREAPEQIENGKEQTESREETGKEAAHRQKRGSRETAGKRKRAAPLSGWQSRHKRW